METPEQVLAKVYELNEKIFDIWDWLDENRDSYFTHYQDNRVKLAEMETLLLEMDTLTEPYRVKPVPICHDEKTIVLTK